MAALNGLRARFAARPEPEPAPDPEADAQQARADASAYFKCPSDGCSLKRIPPIEQGQYPKWKCWKCGTVYDQHCDKGLSQPYAMFSGCSAHCDY